MTNLVSNETLASYVLRLSECSRLDLPSIGTKAAHLAELAQEGFPVPVGFVLTADAFDRFLAANALNLGSAQEAVAAASLPPDVAGALLTAAQELGDVPLAVRSSALAEDLPEASFAGQYETVLDVRGEEALLAAVGRCFASAFSRRVSAYRTAHGQHAVGRMAVLVQRLVAAEAAGVAFTANPVTGDRAETVISAVRGLGERLVSGLATPDEWIVRDQEARCQAAPEGAITADLARALADLARRIEAHVGGTPQDVEWAWAEGEVFLLQARPITALTDPVTWNASQPGTWARHVRLGEWLGDAVTPLFESWLLTRIEERMFADQQRMAGVPPPQPMHVVVNGWYFCSLSFLPSSPAGMLWRLLRYVLPKALVHPRRAAMAVPFTAKFGVELFVREWRIDLLPRHQALVAQGTAQVEQLAPPDLVSLIEALALMAGEYFTSITGVAGFAWKAEMPLAAFYRRHLAPRIGGSHQRLLCGLAGESAVFASHAVTCLDWFHPTLGERHVPAATGPDFSMEGRRRRAEAARVNAEAEARVALAREPKLLARFEQLLARAQRFASIREEQVASFTLGWPLMRRALLRLGKLLRERDVLSAADGIFFLTRAELLETLAAGAPNTILAPVVAERRARWRRQCRLAPPLVLGAMTPMARRVFERTENLFRSTADMVVTNGLSGLPASPGRASGPICVIRTAEEFDRLQPGEVLVAPATTPAWTPLFARALAVVTDTGSPLAHASLAAREYGIPAVVGTGNATERLRDGQVVLVDGNTGVVEVLS
ncbi:MAG TPA: PEP/pyruvate-binding domain-containing protein [Ktedonobacterales bacterium]